MRIKASEYYGIHRKCVLWDCERFYCSDGHRLLYRTCESVIDWGDDCSWYTGECPRCHMEWEMKHARDQWEEHHATRTQSRT